MKSKIAGMSFVVAVLVGMIGLGDLSARAEVVAPANSLDKIISLPSMENISNMAVNQANTRAYVMDDNANSVTILDMESGSVLGVVAVGAFPNMAFMNRNETLLYVLCDSGIYVVSTITNKLVKKISIKSPQSFALSGDSSEAIIASETSSSGYISWLSLTKNTITKSIKVGEEPRLIAKHANSSTFYVGDTYLNKIYQISATTKKITKTIVLANEIQSLLVSNDGSTLIAGMSNYDSGGSIDLYPANSLNTPVSIETTLEPQRLRLSTLSNKLFWSQDTFSGIRSLDLSARDRIENIQTTAVDTFEVSSTGNKIFVLGNGTISKYSLDGNGNPNIDPDLPDDTWDGEYESFDYGSAAYEVTALQEQDTFPTLETVTNLGAGNRNAVMTLSRDENAIFTISDSGFYLEVNLSSTLNPAISAVLSKPSVTSDADGVVTCVNTLVIKPVQAVMASVSIDGIIVDSRNSDENALVDGVCFELKPPRVTSGTHTIKVDFLFSDDFETGTETISTFRPFAPLGEWSESSDDLYFIGDLVSATLDLTPQESTLPATIRSRMRHGNGVWSKWTVHQGSTSSVTFSFRAFKKVTLQVEVPGVNGGYSKTFQKIITVGPTMQISSTSRLFGTGSTYKFKLTVDKRYKGKCTIRVFEAPSEYWSRGGSDSPKNVNLSSGTGYFSFKTYTPGLYNLLAFCGGLSSEWSTTPANKEVFFLLAQ